MQLRLPKQPNAEKGVSGVYLGVCCVCSATVLGDGDLYPRGPSITVCGDEYRKFRETPSLRFIYCLTCRRATFELDFNERDLAAFPDLVLFSHDCPKCNSDFKQFNLKRWTEL